MTPPYDRTVMVTPLADVSVKRSTVTPSGVVPNDSRRMRAGSADEDDGDRVDIDASWSSDQAEASPMAVASTVSGVHSAIGLAGDNRPRHITARRSHSPNSSRRYELTMRLARPAAACCATVS